MYTYVYVNFYLTPATSKALDSDLGKNAAICYACDYSSWFLNFKNHRK